jgi:hypothetical protein
LYACCCRCSFGSVKAPPKQPTAQVQPPHKHAHPPSFAACSAANCATCAISSASTCAGCNTGYTLTNGQCPQREASVIAGALAVAGAGLHALKFERCSCIPAAWGCLLGGSVKASTDLSTAQDSTPTHIQARTPPYLACSMHGGQLRRVHRLGHHLCLLQHGLHAQPQQGMRRLPGIVRDVRLCRLGGLWGRRLWLLRLRWLRRGRPYVHELPAAPAARSAHGALHREWNL